MQTLTAEQRIEVRALPSAEERVLVDGWLRDCLSRDIRSERFSHEASRRRSSRGSHP